MRVVLLFSFLSIFLFSSMAFGEQSSIARWKAEWPVTDFSKRKVDVREILSGGPPKDGIPAIDNPKFVPAEKVKIKETEPVISVEIAGEARAYPISILMYHEIVNDRIAGEPIAVTYCPLCNASIVFERKVEGVELDFGTTGKLRHSDMVMYDRQTESWWQQFTGEAIVGEHVGTKLKVRASRIESFEKFRKRHPSGAVLQPNSSNARSYGTNPYVKYDSSQTPFLYRGNYSGSVPPLSRVVAVGGNAWPLNVVKERKRIEYEDFIIEWSEGQNSALDTTRISEGRDIGNVEVFRENGSKRELVPYHVPFAFAFLEFQKDGVIHSE